MREMKDSGVEWIGEIPKEWQVCRFKNICSLFTGNSIKDEEKSNYEDTINAHPYIATKDIDAVFCTANYENGLYVKNDDIFFKIAPQNSILLCIEGGSAGKKKAIINQNVAFVNKLCCFHSNLTDNKYIYYFLNSPNYENEFKNNITGLIGGVSLSTLKNISMLFPPLSTQHRIADYLDNKCAKIDAIIANERTLIEKLKEYKLSVITEAVTKGLNSNVKMKDSGIEWIGEIPEEWEVRKGKYVLTLLKRQCLDNSEVITCFRDGQVTLRSNRREDGFTFADKEIGYQGIKKGDLVIHGMDGFAGAIGISDSNGKGSPVLNICNSKNNNLFFIKYYLKMLANQNVFLALATGIRERSCDLRWNKIADLLFPIPQISEQQEIIEYLDQKCSGIDAAIAKKQAVIDKITEYKKSLIYEVVTGKKEV